MIKKPKGTRDYFGDDIKKFNLILSKFETLAQKFGFERIIVPSFESEDLFLRSVGETSDIVTKEIYQFEDRSGRKLALRPEGTAPVVRAALENKLIYRNERHKFFYLGSMFRYERPQSGRQREFYQFGVEMFNYQGLMSDLEILLFAKELLDSLKIAYRLEINTIGDAIVRGEYMHHLKNLLADKVDTLSADSKTRLQTNPLRILDSKDVEDQKIVQQLPKLFSFLPAAQQQTFETLCHNLKKQKIDYIINPYLVRGLDYYNDLVFEFISEAKNQTILGGGRYDSLVNQFEPKLNVPAIGFALGIERLMELVDLTKFAFAPEGILLISSSEETDLELIMLREQLKFLEKTLVFDYSHRKISQIIAKAAKDNFKYVIILKREYLTNKKIVLVDLMDKTEKVIVLDENKIEELKGNKGIKNDW